MRDILTAIAGFIILLLLAALVVPPLVDWRGQRDLFERAIARTTGLKVATAGDLQLRLLPSPRVTIEHLLIEPSTPDAPAVDARDLQAEIALEPLLGGEILFRESRADRMEIKLPTGAGGDWRVPRGFLPVEGNGGKLVLEDFAVRQLLVTTLEPQTGRTDQVYAEDVRVGAQSLSGPWRLAGSVAGVPFSVSTGVLGPDRATDVKITVRGQGVPTVELDGKLLLAARPDGSLVPTLTGTARATGATAGSNDAGAGWTATAGMRLAGILAELDNLAVEIPVGTGTLRLEGTGRFDLSGPTLALDLAGRRLDGAALLGETGPLLRSGQVELPPFRTELALKLDFLALGADELTGFNARAALSGNRLQVEKIETGAPGQTRLAGSGAITLGAVPDVVGHLALDSQAGARFAAFVGRLGIGDVPAELLGDVPVSAEADLVVAYPVVSLRNLRAGTGEGSASGTLRYNAPEGGSAARLDAQLALQGLDLSGFAPPPALAEAARSLDLGLTLDARGVSFRGGPKTGRVIARISSEARSLEIARLDIADLGGANASLSGRLKPDGTGQIAGKVTASRGSPVLALLGPYWIGGLAGLVPEPLVAKPVDLTVTAERSPSPDVGRLPLRTRLSGTALGGALDAEILSEGGRVTTVSASLPIERSGGWLGLPGLDAPARVALSGRRDGAGRLALTLTGDVAGLRIGTTRPFTLTPDDTALADGEAELAATDLSPLLGGLGIGTAGSVVPVEAKLRLERGADAPKLRASGRVAGTGFEADLSGRSLGELGGSVSVQSLSLPWLAGATLLGSGPGAGNASPWPIARFRDAKALPVGGSFKVRAASLDLWRGIVGQDATLDLTLGPDALRFDNLRVAIGGGRLGADLAVTRQGGLASLIGSATAETIPLGTVLGSPLDTGRVSGTLRFGGSGESVAALVSNLGGAGTVSVAGLSVPSADPGAVARIAGRALRSDDPLSQPRLAAVAGEELGRGTLSPQELSSSATLVGGTLRIGPLTAESAGATWQGSASVDLRNATLDIRGSLLAKEAPRGWSGPAPSLLVGWSGPVARPTRTVDVSPLVNGLASAVLTRELDRIETFELDAAERARLNARAEMDRARTADEALRQARLREEAERARQDAEARAAERARPAAAGPGAEIRLPPPPPADIRPPSARPAADQGLPASR